jgi:hypothetical protein
MHLTVNNRQKKLGKKLIVCCHLKASAKKSRIRIRNPVYEYKAPDPYQKCHGSGTLGETNEAKRKAR